MTPIEPFMSYGVSPSWSVLDKETGEELAAFFAPMDGGKCHATPPTDIRRKIIEWLFGVKIVVNDRGCKQ